jgi:uncharacterized membrane protein YfcA
MTFPVSGVECPLWVPPAVAFTIALVTAPAGISGAFLLLPFQMTVLGFISPAVTPTNLFYNVIATPGAVYRYARERRLAWPLAGVITAGTLPGVVAGAASRIWLLPDPRRAKLFVGLVVLYLAVRLLRSAVVRSVASSKPTGERLEFSRPVLWTVSLLVGVIGGIYGVGGGAIIAPFAMTMLRLPARMVAGAALFGTLVTSIAGIGSFEILGRGMAARPDWALGALFGAGGLAGSYCGARLQKYLSERWIQSFLGVVLGGLAVAYIGQFFK